jgi:hypothetical protein
MTQQRFHCNFIVSDIDLRCMEPFLHPRIQHLAKDFIHRFEISRVNGRTPTPDEIIFEITPDPTNYTIQVQMYYDYDEWSPLDCENDERYDRVEAIHHVPTVPINLFAEGFGIVPPSGRMYWPLSLLR